LPPERVCVVGSSGSGKTTFARELAARLCVAHVELDALHHQPGWQPLALEKLRAQVDAACPAGGRWVADGNYQKVADLTRDRADVIVWLDLPRPVVIRRLLRRTLRRGLLREELWNGNRESLRNLFRRDPQLNVVLWSWTHHARYREAYAAETDARWVRLRTPAAVAAWLER
jgi:adenylate kinase family enzyme